jgi:hypothetical protein
MCDPIYSVQSYVLQCKGPKWRKTNSVFGWRLAGVEPTLVLGMTPTLLKFGWKY